MKTAITAFAVGSVLILLGKPLTGVLIMSITVIFGLRLLEHQFTAQLIQGREINRRPNAFFMHFADTTGSFLQQFTNSFFACMFWMTQGDMSLVSPAHWITATKTGLGAATVLQIILQVPRLSPLMRGRWRAFIVTSLVISSVDRCIHPGHFGGPWAEALVTGMSAYGLNLAIDYAYELFLALLRL
jgi:hypothetical protein